MTVASTTGALSFQGLSTNLPTDQLVAAVINQESQPMVRMQTQQTTNNSTTIALQTLSADMTSLSASLDSLQSGFSGNTVSSTDSTNAFVSATATGATAGSYDVTVKALATRSRLVLPTAMLPNTPVGTGTYSITDMAGKTVNVAIDASNNSLAGLAAAINAAKDTDGNASDVNATVIQTGADGTSQLVLSANNTGTGTNGASSFTLKAPAGSALDPTAQGTFTSSTATNSDFIVNGVEMTRSSNSVSDAVAGVTFNLNSAQTDLTKATTITVGMDQNAATTAMQAVVSGFNQLYNDYKNQAGFTQNADGSYTTGVFNMDMPVRNMIQQVANTLMAPVTGLPATAPFNSPASVGLKTNSDGSLSLDTTAFTAALTQDSKAVANIFSNSGSSTTPLLTFISSTPKTTSSPIAFNVSTVDNVLTGVFTPAGSSQSYTLTSTDGYFYGASGTPLEGLEVQALSGASGTLTVAAGNSQTVQTLNTALTSLSPGDIGGMISDLSTSNYNLGLQIAQQQDYLANSKAQLETTYSNLEATVGQLNAAGQSLSGIT